jgi:hypothetical protein
MVDLASKQFTMFFTPELVSHERLRIFMFDAKTGHFQAAMEPGTRNVYGVFSSSGRIEFNLTTHGDNVFQHFIGALKEVDANPLWMAGTFIKFTLQTTGQQSGQPFVSPFYAVEEKS